MLLARCLVSLAVCVTASAEAAEGSDGDLLDLFLIQVTAQTFNSSGAKKAVSLNATSLSIVPKSPVTQTLSQSSLRTQSQQGGHGEHSEPRKNSEPSKLSGHSDQSEEGSTTSKAIDGSQIVKEQLGVRANGAADSEALRASLFFNLGLLSAYLALFVVLQRWKPQVYSHNTLIQKAPEPHASWFGIWLSSEEVENYASLDSALMIEFCNLGMKICAFLGLPLCAVLMPVYYAMGKSPGDCPNPVQLSSIDLFSITTVNCHGPPMRWVLACVTWIVVWAVQRILWHAHKKFVQRRVDWLQKRPKPQCSTILVTNIPPRYRADSKLKEYFEFLFPDGIVERVYLVKKLAHLAALLEEFDVAEQRLHESQYLWLLTDKDPSKRPRTKVIQDAEAEAVDSINHYTALVEHLQRQIEGEREQIRRADSFTEEELSGAAAFVTFRGSRDAEMALRLRLEPEGHLFTMEYPPVPKDVSYEDLLRGPAQRQLLHLFGYLLIFMVFLFFFPLIGAASSIINLQNLERIDFVHNVIYSSTWAQSVLEGIFATLLLSVFMAFLPTTLHVIIGSTFTLNSKAESQLYLQQWYYWFQVVFVLLVTAIGTSLWQRFADVVKSPTSVVLDLALSLPNTSTFYMNYIILQWSVSVLNILRYQNVLKFLAWSAVSEEARAKELSEPEDPDYYGIGSRSARMNLVLAIGLVFSLFAPITLGIAFIYFLINRLVFSYLVVFAESPKPDLGGYFWSQQLRHAHLSLPIFVVVMSGCLWTDPYGGPGLLALASIALWGFEYSRWIDILWETLSFRAVVEGAAKGSATSEEVYIQPELSRELKLPSIVASKAG